MDLSQAHTGFVVAAYVISAGVLVLLVLRTFLGLRAREKELATLEQKSMQRRRPSR